MDPEIIDVDSFEPEIEVVAYNKRTFDLSGDTHTTPRKKVRPSTRPAKGPSSSRFQSITGGPSPVPPKVVANAAQKRPTEGGSLGGPRAKRQCISGPSTSSSSTSPSPLNISQSSAPASSRGGSLKRKDREIIDLREDDSNEEVHTMLTKMSRFSQSDDSEDDYTNNHAGLNINDSQNWQPLEKHDDDDLLLESLEDLSVLETPREDVRLRPKVLTRDRHDPHTSFAYQGGWIWTALRNSHVLTPNYGRRPQKLPLLNDLQYHALQLSSSFREAAGSINKIIQRSGTIAICSAAVGGQPDEDGEELNSYNRPGSLMIWNGKAHKLQGHDREWSCSEEQERVARQNGTDAPVFHKYFSVNDVKFDPSRVTRMVSSGNDLTIRVWACEDHQTSDSSTPSVQLEHTIYYDAVPHDLAFKPEDTVLAVGCQNAKIFIHRDLDTAPQEGTKTALTIAPKNSLHCTGAMSWGLQGTSNYIFASSEPPGEDEYRGFHGAFDVNTLTKAYTFNAKEAGDAMALDSNGEKLAIFTRGSASQHILRLYDVRRKLSQDVSTCDLERFAENADGEVTCATFSPDGIYLAAARSDNRTDIYDARNIGRGVLHVFEHTGPSRSSPGSDCYGVVEAVWVESASSRLGLVTGGNDGCVRLWDVRKASNDPMNGTVLAETAFDVGYFSLGDPLKGQKPLVVGDCGGGVFIFDHIGNSALW